MSKLSYKIKIIGTTDKMYSICSYCREHIAENNWDIDLTSLSPTTYTFSFNDEHDKIMVALLA
jgi:hypothetical protein